MEARKQDCITRSEDASDRKSHKEGTPPAAICPTRSPRQQRARGAVSSLAPRPAVLETHLAPCWTFIRPDSHQMVCVLAPEQCGPGLGAARLGSAGSRVGAFLSDRCPAAVGACGEGGWNQGYPLCLHFVTWNLWKGGKSGKPFKFVFKRILLKVRWSEENPRRWKHRGSARALHLEP